MKIALAFICGFTVSRFFFFVSILNTNDQEERCAELLLAERNVSVTPVISHPPAESLARKILADTPNVPASANESKIQNPPEQTTDVKLGSLTYPAFPYHRGVYPPFFLQRPYDFDNRTAWNREDVCRYSSAWLRAAAASPSQQGGVCRHDNEKCPIYVHTELLLKRNTTMVDYRKEQLPVLSFLATQHESVIMNILVNEEDYANPPAWVTALLQNPKYKHRLRLEHWDIKTMDAGSLPPDFLPAFQDAFENLAHAASRSDVRRYAVLYHYGGLWFDTDSIYITDVRPLMGYDYVVVADKNKLNNGAIGTHQRHSEMMKRILYQVVEAYKNKNDGKYYRFGPYLFEDIRRKRKEPMPFGVLSACMFDAWGGHAKNSPWWWDFNSKQATKRMMQFFQDQNGPFAYHWHGLWSEKIQPGSTASILHKNFVEQLGLDPEVFKAAMDEEDWTKYKDHKPFEGRKIPLPEGYF